MMGMIHTNVSEFVCDHRSHGMSSTLLPCSLVSVAFWWCSPITSAVRAATHVCCCEYLSVLKRSSKL